MDCFVEGQDGLESTEFKTFGTIRMSGDGSHGTERHEWIELDASGALLCESTYDVTWTRVAPLAP